MNPSPINAQILLHAKSLRLPTLKGYEQILRVSQDKQDTYEEFLLKILDAEYNSRQANQQRRRIRSAKFPFEKTLDEFDIRRLEHIPPNVIWELSACDYIDKKQNIIMIGNPGTGKTHLAIALGMKACHKGYDVLFSTAANLAVQLGEAETQHKLSRLLKQLNRIDLLILDELSYLSFNKAQSELLFQVISERSERGSIILTTNLEFSKWEEFFPDTMLTSALIDRITYRSAILNMNGTSYRLHKKTK